MSGKFIVKKARGGQFMWNLHASNGRVILTSELYKSKAAAKNGIQSVKKNSSKDRLYDRRNAKNGPMFCLCAPNGEVIGRSEVYSSYSGRNNGIASVKRNARGAALLDET